jgi:hypothetical protein
MRPAVATKLNNRSAILEAPNPSSITMVRSLPPCALAVTLTVPLPEVALAVAVAMPPSPPLIKKPWLPPPFPPVAAAEAVAGLLPDAVAVAVAVALPPLPPLPPPNGKPKDDELPPVPPEALLNALAGPVLTEVIAVDAALPPFPPTVPAPPAPPKALLDALPAPAVIAVVAFDVASPPFPPADTGMQNRMGESARLRRPGCSHPAQRDPALRTRGKTHPLFHSAPGLDVRRARSAPKEENSHRGIASFSPYSRWRAGAKRTLKTALGDLVHNAPPCFSALRGGQSLPQNLYGCFREYEVIFLVDIKTLDSRHRVEGERRHIETISVAFVLSDDFRSRYDEHDKIDIF